MLDGRTVERSTAFYEGVAVISIFDYCAGNLRSVQNTLDEIGAQYELVRDAEQQIVELANNTLQNLSDGD